MAELKISQMDAAQPLTGAELVPLVQGGINVTATAADMRGTADTLPGLAALLAGKQSTLVSGTDIKTLNGESLLGAGNIEVSVGDEDVLPEVVAPSHIFPAPGEVVATKLIVLAGGPFFSLYGASIAAAQVQVSGTEDFASPIYSSGEQTTGTQVALPVGTLMGGANYYWRMRYKNTRGVYSAWSAPTPFSTAVVLGSYIPMPTPTPAAFGDVLEGGFYAGMIWNELSRSSTATTIGMGAKVFTIIADMDTVPLVYVGQQLEVRSRANPENKMSGVVVSASGTALAINADSIGGSGTFSDWSVMSRFRVIVAPKAGGENPGVMIKVADNSVGIASQTSSEGLRSTLSMVATGGVSVYPAANWARSLVLGGRTDWYIPARDELELLWRNLKPTTNDNFVSLRRVASAYDYRRDGAYGDAADPAHGENKNSYPVGAAYTATVPARSANTMFHAGGAEALEFWASPLLYWSSTEFSPTNMVRQNSFAASEGFQGNSTKTALIRVRAVRRSII